MDQWKDVDEVLDFAIAREEEAAAFYSGLADKATQPWMKATFKSFAREEEGHKAKLLGVKKGRTMKPSEKKVLDLKIAEYLVDVDASGDLDYQQALIVGMKNEKAAFKLYSDLADSVDDEGLKDTFLALAQEEARHKLRFEVEYDKEILKEN